MSPPLELGIRAHDRNALLTSAWFWEQTSAEFLLLFDATTRLCAMAPKTVDDFVGKGYAWVGAPWPDVDASSALARGGNGMLSLRRRSAMLRVTRAHTGRRKEGNEDMWFAERLFDAMKADAAATKGEGSALNATVVAVRLPTSAVARTFAVETVFYPAPVGVSYAMRTLTTAQRSRVLQRCPEARALAGYLPGASWISDVRGGGDGKEKYSLCAARQRCCSAQKTEIHWKTKKKVPLPPCPVD